MARILGRIASGLTIAALFRTSFELFDIIQTTRNQEPEYEKLRLRLRIEKCRLHAWGESMGMNDSTNSNRRHPIDNLQFPRAVRDILISLILLFDDAERIKDKYGCRVSTPADASLNHSLRVASEVSPTKPVTQTITWIIYDRRKFTVLLAEIKDLIDRLKEVTVSDVSADKQLQDPREMFENRKHFETSETITNKCSTNLSGDAKLYPAALSYDSGKRLEPDDWSFGPRIPKYGNPRL